MLFRLTEIKAAAKQIAAASLVLLLLTLSLASASEPLHKALHHHESGSDADACAVCMLANGLLESPLDSAVLPLIVFLVICGLPVFTSIFTGRSEFLLPPGRAPPSASHLTMVVG